MIGEFDIIEKIFRPLAGKDGLRLADDVALLSRHANIVTKDLLIAGTHFLADDPANLIARKALRTNISDIICKGAKPIGYLLGLALPRSCESDWLQKFAEGLAQDQQEFRFNLLGGDTTRHAADGILVISITMFGSMKQGQKPVLRSEARAGDLLAVSGTIGDAGLGLAVARGELSLDAQADEYLTQRYRLPVLRPELAEAVATHASASLDISDGLIADAGHIASASELLVEIDLDRLPVSPAVQAWLATQPDKSSALATLASFGDDYQILLTASSCEMALIQKSATERNVPFTVIGRCKAGEGVSVFFDGKEITPPKRGHDHFS